MRLFASETFVVENTSCPSYPIAVLAVSMSYCRAHYVALEDTCLGCAETLQVRLALLAKPQRSRLTAFGCLHLSHDSCLALRSNLRGGCTDQSQIVSQLRLQCLSCCWNCFALPLAAYKKEARTCINGAVQQRSNSTKNNIYIMTTKCILVLTLLQ